MMRVRYAQIVCVCLGLLLWTVADALAQGADDGLAVGIATQHIDVTAGFTGSSIELFGDRRNAQADIAIVVEGPGKNTTIWKKVRVMGAWVNRHYLMLRDMPVYYHYATTIAGDIDDTTDLIMRHNRIGHEALFASVESRKSRGVQDVSAFQDVFLREKQAQGVYFQNAADIRFMNPHFFRIAFDIPASAPTGAYKIHSFLIEDGHVVEQKTQVLKVEQVGLNAFINTLSKRHSLIYALSCIALALFFGWFASVVKVRP